MYKKLENKIDQWIENFYKDYPDATQETKENHKSFMMEELKDLKPNIKLIWNGNFYTTDYLIKIDGKTHTCLDSTMNIGFAMPQESFARKEAEQWLIAYGYTTKDFDVYSEPFEFGGFL